MRDFTLDMYRQLCLALVEAGYRSRPIGDYAEDADPDGRPRVYLRHDIDRAPKTALGTARVERDLGLTATYFFRLVSGAFVPEVVAGVRDLGMEVGYHYECLDRAAGDTSRALEICRDDLEKLRAIAPVRSMAMHGNPLTKYDNRDMWKQHDYREFGIEVAAYFTIDYTKVRYYSDTGRNWDESKGKMYDLVDSGQATRLTTTRSLIEHLKTDRRDTCILTHPNRWTNGLVSWSYNAAFDYAALIAKRLLSAVRGRKQPNNAGQARS